MLMYMRMLFRTEIMVMMASRLDTTFNLRRLKAKIKVQTNVLNELFYADDMERKKFLAMGRVSQACDNYDPTSSTKSR